MEVTFKVQLEVKQKYFQPYNTDTRKNVINKFKVNNQNTRSKSLTQFSPTGTNFQRILNFGNSRKSTDSFDHYFSTGFKFSLTSKYVLQRNKKLQ